MKNRAEADDEAVSVQVGFVLNTGILTAFIAIVLVVISGGFDDTSTEDELELVRDSVEAKIVEADTLAEESDSFTAFFEPPESDLQYRAKIDGGTLTLRTPRDDEEVESDIDSLLPKRNVSNIQFSQIDQNIAVEYESNSCPSVPKCPLELRVQRNATRSR